MKPESERRKKKASSRKWLILHEIEKNPEKKRVAWTAESRRSDST